MRLKFTTVSETLSDITIVWARLGRQAHAGIEARGGNSAAEVAESRQFRMAVMTLGIRATVTMAFIVLAGGHSWFGLSPEIASGLIGFVGGYWLQISPRREV